jgi:hypothetical protein
LSVRKEFMNRVFFTIEVEDCLWDEVGYPPDNIAAHLEVRTIKYMSELFGVKVTTNGQRNSDGALICFFQTNDIARVRQIIKENLISEGNDQIVSGAEYVIVMDFQYE